MADPTLEAAVALIEVRQILVRGCALLIESVLRPHARTEEQRSDWEERLLAASSPADLRLTAVNILAVIGRRTGVYPHQLVEAVRKRLHDCFDTQELGALAELPAAPLLN